MKFQLVILVVALFFALTFALSCTDDSWSEYKEKFNKTYSSEEDELRHRKTFCESIELIEKHNELFKKGETTYELGVNQFADLSHDELFNSFGGGFTNKKDN